MLSTDKESEKVDNLREVLRIPRLKDYRSYARKIFKISCLPAIIFDSQQNCVKKKMILTLSATCNLKSVAHLNNKVGTLDNSPRESTAERTQPTVPSPPQTKTRNESKFWKNFNLKNSFLQH